METSRVSFEAVGRSLDAYLARPAAEGTRRPAIVVVHEIWGLVPHIEDVARRFADQGYVALAPDLYTGELREAMAPSNIRTGMLFLRQAPPEVQRDPAKMDELLSQRTPEERKALGALMRVMAPEQRRAFGSDLVAATRYLRDRPDVDPDRIGSVGFCMGGGLSGLLAVLDPKLRACVIFYGENPPLDRVSEIQAPVLGLYGGTDARITDNVPELEMAMHRAGRAFEYRIYPHAGHAFFNDGRKETYHADAAADAWQRTLSFFGRELTPNPLGTHRP